MSIERESSRPNLTIEQGRKIAEMLREMPYHSAIAAIQIGSALVREQSYVDMPVLYGGVSADGSQDSRCSGLAREQTDEYPVAR